VNSTIARVDLTVVGPVEQVVDRVRQGDPQEGSREDRSRQPDP
jgi:hypothetical protein